MNDKEQQKIILASALLASAIAAIALPFNHLAVSPVKFILLLSGVFFFGYLLLTAAQLKSKNPGEIVFIFNTEKWRNIFFDAAVNVYGLAIVGMMGLLGLSKGLLESFLSLLFNEDTIIGWLALVLSGLFILLIHVIVRFVVLLKYKRWFWRLSSYYEFRKEQKRIS